MDHSKDALYSDATNNFELSYLTDCYNTEKLSETYIHCSENKIFDFSLSFKISRDLSPFCVQSIISFLFIPGYGKLKKVINLICTNPQSFQLYSEVAIKLKTAAKLQGIENLSVNLLSGATAVDSAYTDLNEPIHNLFIDPKELLKAYTNTLDRFQINNNIFYLLDPLADPIELYNKLNKVDLHFKNTYPDVFKIVKSKVALTEETELLKIKNLYLQNELNNYIDHNNILRSNHVATELQRYYDNEYEILPTWYKQVGHLLKVVLGKRTVRSLFNKKIKKYQA